MGRAEILRQPELPEGYGLQAVRKCFAMDSALAAEGCFPLQTAVITETFEEADLGIRLRGSLADE